MREERKLQLASGQFLTTLIPDGFFDWEELQQNEFLEEHASEMYECTDGAAIWELIEDTADLLTIVIEEQSHNIYKTI